MHVYKYNYIDGQSADKDYAYVLGVYIGDGCISKPKNTKNKWSLQLEVIDKDFAEEFATCLERLGSKVLRYFDYEYPSRPHSFFHRVVCRNHDLIKTFLRDTDNKKKIPEYVYKWSRENQMKFIEGIMDSEGYISKRTQIMTNGLPSFMMGIKMDYEILKQIRPIFQHLNIRTGKYTMGKCYANVQTANLSINLWSWTQSGVHFNIKRKEDRVKAYVDNQSQRLHVGRGKNAIPKDIVRTLWRHKDNNLYLIPFKTVERPKDSLMNGKVVTGQLTLECRSKEANAVMTLAESE